MFPVGRISGLSIMPCSPRAVCWTDPRAGRAAWRLVATWEESIIPACELWGVLNMKATQRTGSFVQSFLCLSFECIFSIIFEVNSPCGYKDELNKKDEAFLCHHLGLECQSWERSQRSSGIEVNSGPRATSLSTFICVSTFCLHCSLIQFMTHCLGLLACYGVRMA